MRWKISMTGKHNLLGFSKLFRWKISVYICQRYDKNQMSLFFWLNWRCINNEQCVTQLLAPSAAQQSYLRPSCKPLKRLKGNCSRFSCYPNATCKHSCCCISTYPPRDTCEVLRWASCLSVYLFASDLKNQTSRNFLFMLHVAVARSVTDNNAIPYVLPVLWMRMSCFHNGPNAVFFLSTTTKTKIFVDENK